MIVVLGSRGQLGTAFRRRIPPSAGLFLDRDELDLARTEAIGSALAHVGGDTLINCTGYTAVDAAEHDEQAALRLNALAPRELARHARSAGMRFVTFSTDYVFDGTKKEPYVESDATRPINAYGRSKLEGERQVLAAHPGSLVVRTSWLVSGTHPNFVDTILRAVAERRLRVVADQTGCPTVADDLAAATLGALEHGVEGLLHLTNRGPTTWYALARAAVELAGIDPERVQPCATQDYPRPAARPANSVLASERAPRLGLDPLPDWRTSLPAVVRELLSRS